MNNSIKYWLAALALLVWLVLSWFIPSWLHLQGSNVWMLRIVLALTGTAAFVTIVWWFRIREKERAAEMAQGASGGATEIDTLMREAESRLQASSLGRHARLGNLPALFLLGESGSAKTSVVQHSGLEAELLAGHTGQEKVPVPTRAANLWFARQFILAEAGGPVLSDPARWARFVKRLAPGRLHSVFGKGTQAPRAALVCVDCESFMKPRAMEALGASVERLRTRLREVAHILGINLPVYVLFTRADRLRFFQDYVRNLSNDEATQVFGATLPMVSFAGEVYAEQETARVAAAFDELGYSLAEKRLIYLPREFDMAKRAAVYEFPREFRKLRQMLVQWLVDLCRPSQLRTGPFLRGFYFCGVRPIVISTPAPTLAKGDAIGPLGGSDAAIRATGIFNVQSVAPKAARPPLVTEAAESRRVAQWTFVPHLFNDVLLRDASALATSASSSKTSLWRRVFLASAIGLLLILMIGLIVSYTNNSDLESQMLNAAMGVSNEQMAPQQLPALDALNRLENLRKALEELAGYRRGRPPLSLRWGLYVGDRLYPDVQKIYFQHFGRLLLKPTQDQLLRTLHGLPAAAGQCSAVYDTLKTYLITTTENRQTNEKITRQFLPPALLVAWAAERDVDTARTELARSQFNFYSKELGSENPVPYEFDSSAVTLARNYLSKSCSGQGIYQQMLADASKTNQPIRFHDPQSVVVDPTVVDGAFTKSGWAFMQEAFKHPEKYAGGEVWVLGTGGSENVGNAKLLEYFQSEYQQDYIDHWRAFLKSGRVLPYNGLADASQKLNKISGNQSPLLALFCVAEQNTADPSGMAKAFQPVQVVVPSDCAEQQFIGPSNSAYVTALMAIPGCLDQANSGSPEQKESATTQCVTGATQARLAAQQIANSFKINQPETAPAAVEAQRLLLEPITNLSAMLRPEQARGEGLCQQMRPLLAKFPFNPQATVDTSLDELMAIFDPASGSLTKLHNEVTKSGHPQGPSFHNFIERAMSVQRALYPSGPGPIQFKYALRPHPTEGVSSLTANIDGQTLTYSGGNAEFKQLTWPGAAEGIKSTVNITGTPFEWASFDGMWGVFRFFAVADNWQKNGPTYNIEWVIRGAGGVPMKAPSGKAVTVQFDLDTGGAPPVFQKNYFAGLQHCVSNVAK